MKVNDVVYFKNLSGDVEIGIIKEVLNNCDVFLIKVDERETIVSLNYIIGIKK